MKKRDLLFVFIVVVVVSGLVYLERTGRHPRPVLQSIPEHANLKAQTPRTTCLVCHDPQNGTNPDDKRIKVDHPEKWKDEKFPCIGCHKIQPGPNKTAQLLRSF